MIDPSANPQEPDSELDDDAISAARSQEMSNTVELVRRYHEGEEGTLEALFARYYDRVLRIVRIRMGRRLRSRMESVDIVQNTFGAAMVSLRDFEMREPGSLIQWLSQIAENQLRGASDYLGAQRRDSRLEVTLSNLRSALKSGEFQFDPAADITSPIESLARAETREALDECVAELPDDYREVILLRNFAGCSWDHITEEMGRVSTRATVMLHARARVALLKIAERRLDP